MLINLQLNALFHLSEKLHTKYIIFPYITTSATSLFLKHYGNRFIQIADVFSLYKIFMEFSILDSNSMTPWELIMLYITVSHSWSHTSFSCLFLHVNWMRFENDRDWCSKMQCNASNAFHFCARFPEYSFYFTVEWDGQWNGYVHHTRCLKAISV